MSRESNNLAVLPIRVQDPPPQLVNDMRSGFRISFSMFMYMIYYNVEREGIALLEQATDLSCLKKEDADSSR